MMNPFSLPENEYKNVTCWSQKDGVVIPDGYVITSLSITQLKKLKIPTAKAFMGFDYVHVGGRWGRRLPRPKLGNLIRIEDEPRAIRYGLQVEMYKKYKFNKAEDLDWLFN